MPEHNTANTEFFLQPLKSVFSVGTERKDSLGQGSSGMVKLSLELRIVSCPRDLLPQVPAGSGPGLSIPFFVLFLLLLAANVPGLVPAGLAWEGLQ